MKEPSANNSRLALLVLAVCVAAGGVSYQAFDIPVMYWVRDYVAEGSRFFKVCFYVSRLGGASFLTLLGLSLYFFPNFIWPFLQRLADKSAAVCVTRRYHLIMIHFALVAGIGSIVANIAKFFIGRARPFMFLEQGTYGFLGPVGIRNSDSLPSGHTVAIWGAALVLSYAFPKWRWFFFLIAFAVGLTRILLLRHWVSDIFAGIALAIALNQFFRPAVFSPGKDVSYSAERG